MSGCYDARKAGADCDRCPLRGQKPLAPLAPQGASVAVVGRAPDTTAIRYQRPYTGPAGTALTRALHRAGQTPGECHYTYAMLCETPGGDYESYLRELRKHNTKRENEGQEPIPAPHVCCSQRLDRELQNIDNIIALGKQGANAILGGNNSILSIRGALEVRASPNGGDRRIMPTVTPNFVFARPRWGHVFVNDIRKAIKWFRGDAPWAPPEYVLNPPVREVQAFLSDKTAKYTFDVETDGIECLTAKLRCIGIGNGKGRYISVGFRSNRWPKEYTPPVDPLSPEALVLDFYYGDDKKDIVSVCRQFFADPEIIKIAHNGGYYDFLVILKQLGVEIPLVSLKDTIIAHRNIESEMPHTLAYVTSLYAFSPAWKCDREGNKIALGGESDEQLHKYCVTDVQNTEAVYPVVGELVARRKAGRLVQMDHKIQRICAHMHATGMYVDQENRLEREKKGLARRHRVLSEIQQMTGWPTFNPGSTQQLQELVYRRWKASPDVDEKELYTATGNKATGDVIMRALLMDRRVPQHQREVVKRIRIFRKAQKILGTYVTKLRPSNMAVEDNGWDDDEDWVDQETRRLYGEIKRGIVDPRTGRMYPGYSAHVTATGRLSSSKPINAQNFPGELRDMVVAAPGHILVGADMDQVELRIAAAKWGVKLYLRAFEEGKDPHSMTAFACFGEAFCKEAGIDSSSFKKPGIFVGKCYDENGVFDKNKASKEAKKMRDLSKIVQYLSQYKGSAETGWKSLRKTEVAAKNPETGKYYDDGTTDLPYALMPFSRYAEMHANWLRGAPEFTSGWDMEIATYRKYGYLWEPVTGRRRDFLDGENPNEIVNYPIQASAAGLMNKAIINIFDAIGFEPWGPGTGIINQCHDSIVIECPLDGATHDGKKWNIPVGSIPWRMGKLLEECMSQEHPALPGVRFTASAGYGRTWKEVG